MSGLFDVLDLDRYRPLAWCLNYDTTIISLYVIAYLASGVSFLIMGLMLFATRNRTHVLLSSTTRGLYGTLGILLGLCYLSKMTTIFVGAYWLDIIIAMATAGVGVATAALTTRESIGLKQPHRG